MQRQVESKDLKQSLQIESPSGSWTVHVHFEDQWEKEYMRNNKTGANKNLLCFPGCQNTHPSSFCGKSVDALVTFSKNAFDNTDSKANASAEIEINSICRSLEFLGEIQDRNGILPWVNTLPIKQGEFMSKNSLDDLFVYTQSGPVYYQGKMHKVLKRRNGLYEARVDFNTDPKCWQYRWISNKHVNMSDHAFCIRVFQRKTSSFLSDANNFITDGIANKLSSYDYKLNGSIRSPIFKVMSKRRALKGKDSDSTQSLSSSSSSSLSSSSSSSSSLAMPSSSKKVLISNGTFSKYREIDTISSEMNTADSSSDSDDGSEIKGTTANSFDQFRWKSDDSANTDTDTQSTTTIEDDAFLNLPGFYRSRSNSNSSNSSCDCSSSSCSSSRCSSTTMDISSMSHTHTLFRTPKIGSSSSTKPPMSSYLSCIAAIATPVPTAIVRPHIPIPLDTFSLLNNITSPDWIGSNTRHGMPTNSISGTPSLGDLLRNALTPDFQTCLDSLLDNDHRGEGLGLGLKVGVSTVGTEGIEGGTGSRILNDIINCPTESSRKKQLSAGPGPISKKRGRKPADERCSSSSSSSSALVAATTTSNTYTSRTASRSNQCSNTQPEIRSSVRLTAEGLEHLRLEGSDLKAALLTHNTNINPFTGVLRQVAQKVDVVGQQAIVNRANQASISVFSDAIMSSPPASVLAPGRVSPVFLGSSGKKIYMDDEEEEEEEVDADSSASKRSKSK